MKNMRKHVVAFCVRNREFDIERKAVLKKLLINICYFVLDGMLQTTKTLDLNKEFPLIAAQLDKLTENFFGKEVSKIG